MNSVAQLVASLQIQNSNNAHMLLDSGLNLFNIMANLCSKLYCEVLLKSWNYLVSIEVDFCFGLQQERLCKTDLSGLKLSVSIASLCSKLLCTKVREVYRIFRNETLVCRIWIIRQYNTVWVCKLADIITSLVFVNCALSQQKHDTYMWNH